METNDQLVLTPETSGCGKRNAFNVACSVVGHYRPYAVCLHLCNERKAGRLSPIYAECSSAIGKKICPALAMRNEEKVANKAIYFVERVKTFGEAVVSASMKAGKFVASKVSAATTPLKSTASGKSSVIDKISTADYSTAINAAMKKVEVAAAPAISIQAVELKAGESPLEMARRMMQSQSK